MIFSSRSSGNRCDIFVFWRSTSLFRFMNRVHHPLETRKLSIFICCAVFWACKRIRFLVTASPLFLFSSTHSTTFFSSSGHWHFLPRSAHLVFGRDFMLSIFLLRSRTNFSSMPNFRLAAELLELSDANLTTCNLKLAEYFIRFTFDNILLHVTQAKKTNREVRHLALPVLFSQLELIYT